MHNALDIKDCKSKLSSYPIHRSNEIKSEYIIYVLVKQYFFYDSKYSTSRTTTLKPNVELGNQYLN